MSSSKTSSESYHGRRRSVILDYLDDHPKSTSRQIAEALGIAQKNISSRLAQLEKAGSVERQDAESQDDPRTKVAWSISTSGKKASGGTGVEHSTGTSEVMAGATGERFRERYFEFLLEQAKQDNPPEWVLERIERMAGLR